MKPYGERKVTIIGLGFLMEYIFPCFRQGMGGDFSARINATTADAGDLAGKKQRLGIEVLLGDNAGALRALRPDMIFFAPPPTLGREIVEAVLVPYYQECRQRGEALPQLLAFPPSPAGAYYLEQLGEDVQVVNIIPNMISSVGEEDVSSEASHLVTFPERDNWPGEEKQALAAFFQPMGRSLFVPPSLILPVLSAEIGVHPLTELADIAARSLSESGVPCTYQQTASVMRACHQQQRGYRSPGSNDCSTEAIQDAGAKALLRAAVEGWYGALHSFLTEVGFPAADATSLLDPLFDLYLHEAQVEDRDTIVAKAKKDATKGGMLELCMASYYAVLEPLWDGYFAVPEQVPDTAALMEMARIVREIAFAVVERGKGLADSDAGHFTPQQHAVLFALLAKEVLDAFGTERGDAVLQKAVRKYGNQRGSRMAQRALAHGKPLDMESYQAFTEWRYPGDFEKSPLFEEPYRAYKVLQCPWFAAWERTGLGEYGKYYCRTVDVSLLAGFSPALTLEMPKYHSQGGDDYCEFHWKDIHPSPAQEQRKAAIDAEIGDSCLKDFVYHSAHLYRTLTDVAKAEDKALGETVALRARAAFADCASYQEWLRVLAQVGQDFDKA